MLTYSIGGFVKWYVQGVVKIIETPDFIIIIVCDIYFNFTWIDL